MNQLPKIPPPPPPEPRQPIPVTAETDNFCPTSLRDWLQVCQYAGVPHIPAERIATIQLQDYLQYDTPGEHQERLLAAIQQAQAALKPRHMVRFDCCAPMETKSRLSQGSHEWHPDLARIILDDPRLYDIMWEQPREEVPLWQRPWINATRIEGYPVEYRVFVTNGEVNGVSNYYPQRPLPLNLAVIQQAQTSIDLTNLLIQHLPTPFLWNQSLLWIEFKENLDSNGIHFTADFLADAAGQVLFIEGGPPHQMGAHPCCFSPGQTYGVALANRNPRETRPRQPGPYISADLDTEAFAEQCHSAVNTLHRRHEELTTLASSDSATDLAWDGDHPVAPGAALTTLWEVANQARTLLADPQAMQALSPEEAQTLQQIAAKEYTD